MKRYACSLFLLSALTVTVSAEDKAKPTVVDSGRFGILVNGARVATETFRVEQRGTSSFVISELKLEDPNSKVMQSAELEMGANGMLKKYTWKEIKPGEAQIVVQPQDDQFLTTRITENGSSAPKEVTHALSPVTSIMDDNFFSQMQVLAWKYMASGCRPGPNGQNECTWDRRQFPILNPHQHESLLVSLEFTGMQKFKIKGEEHNFKTLKIKGETGEWTLWFNEENKLVRVVIAAENTEVLRD